MSITINNENSTDRSTSAMETILMTKSQIALCSQPFILSGSFFSKKKGFSLCLLSPETVIRQCWSNDGYYYSIYFFDISFIRTITSPASKDLCATLCAKLLLLARAQWFKSFSYLTEKLNKSRKKISLKYHDFAVSCRSINLPNHLNIQASRH